jgi:hypothetical protein
VTKLENETVSDAAAQERIERVAEKAAEKPSRTEQGSPAAKPWGELSAANRICRDK